MLESKNKNSTVKCKDVAAVYLRVSTEKQGERGYSIEQQLESAREYADRKELKLLDDLIFQERKPATPDKDHVSNRLNIFDSFKSRPELCKLLESAEKGGFCHLIVLSRDRLCRFVEDALNIEGFFEECNIRVHYINDGDDSDIKDEKIKKLVHIVKISLAEMEANVLASRSRNGSRTGAQHSRWQGGKTPLGYIPRKLTDTSKGKKRQYTVLEKSDFESILIERVFELYASGMGYSRIADAMQEESSFMNWTRSKVEGIIKNSTYNGQIAWGRRFGRRGKYRKNEEGLILSNHQQERAIIDSELWMDIVDERQLRSNNKDAFYYNTDYILKDRLVCSKCKRLMKPRNPGVNRSSVYRCANDNAEREICNTIIPCDVVEKAFIDYMKKAIFNIQSVDKFWEIYNSKFDEKVQKHFDKIKEINNRIRYYKEVNEKIGNQISKIPKRKENNKLIHALECQHEVYGKLIKKYEKSSEFIVRKIDINQRSKEEFDLIVTKFIPIIFWDTNSQEITRIRREFIIRFVDKIEVRYDKETKTVFIEKIEFTPPKFI